MSELKAHTPQVQFSKITEQIYLGTNLCCTTKSHISILLDEGISADIDLEIERQEQTPGVEFYLWIPVVDREAPNMAQLKVGVAAMEELIRNNKKLYVHCKNGHGRSPTLAAAYFIQQGKSVDEAIETIKDARPEIHLEEVQRRVLEDYYQMLNEKN